MFRAMKNNLGRLLNACSLMTLISAPLWAGAQTSSPPTPASADEAFYTMGLNMGQQLHQNGVTAEVSINRVEQGIKDGLAGKKTLAADQMRLQAFLRSAAEAAAAKNAAAAHEYLDRNAKAKGVTTTTAGLQYKIIEAGNLKAASPQPTDLVTLRFRGTFLDGTEFDSSSKPGTAAAFQVNGVMKAWQEALTLMKPGAKWQLFVPPELGYGQGSRPGIPGGSLLIYDIELQSIQAMPRRPSAQ
jgi:FKBP-type peptidyl-prolyl cis-trans isomerase FklB